MKILYFDTLDSTQSYLKEALRSKNLTVPVCVVANRQTNGLGSRGNEWNSIEGNLFFSFAIDIDSLPTDLKLESVSIYFAYLLKELLCEYGSKVWLKWPNDFYIQDLKIGGLLTNMVGKNIICGIGLNLTNAPDGFEKLDIEIDKKTVLQKYIKKIEKFVLWKQVFSKYKLEFYRNEKFFTHNGNRKLSLDDAELCLDGSLLINGERIYSLR